MKVKLKNGDTYLEVDSKFPDDQVDTLENNSNPINWEEDTLEVKIDDLNGEFYE